MEDLVTIHKFANQIRGVQNGSLVVPSMSASVVPYVPAAPYVTRPTYPESRVIPRHIYDYPPSRIERYRWWIVGTVSACAMGVVALVIWLSMELFHALTTVATGVATGVASVLPLLALGVLALLLCSRGGGGNGAVGKTFSGTFTGRIH
jgi:hypothetical protein